MNKGRVLIACDFSGTLRDAITRISPDLDVWSCDILESEKPGNHYQGDVMDIINDGWDAMIAFPPCTFLSSVSNRWDKDPHRLQKKEEAFVFFKLLWSSGILRIAIENPVGYLNSHFRKPDQIINPFQFGDNYRKRTCLWLKNFKKLTPSIALYRPPKPICYLKNGKKKGQAVHFVESNPGQKERFRTFPGIAAAMAEQWFGGGN